MTIARYFCLALICCWLHALSVHAQIVAPSSYNDRIEELIVDGPWISELGSPAEAPAVYVFHWRECPYCVAFKRNEKAALTGAGVDVRTIMFPTTRSDSDEIAYLSLQRDRELLERHDRGFRLGAPPRASSNALVTAFNQAVYAVHLIDEILKSQGDAIKTPTFVYDDGSGNWKILSGYSVEDFAPIRAALSARAAQVQSTSPSTPDLQAPQANYAVVIPQCMPLISWAYQSAKVDMNLRGREYTGGRQPGSYRLWGLRPEQMIATFGAPLRVWTQSDFDALQSNSLRCLDELQRGQQGELAAWQQTGGRGDDSNWRRLADLHKYSNMFINHLLHMNRPIRDEFYFPTLITYQQALARDWHERNETR